MKHTLRLKHLLALAPFLFCMFVPGWGWGQANNPTAQALPYTQNFGTTTFTTMPTGMISWNGLNGSNVSTQALAEASSPTSTASLAAVTAPSGTGGSYGYATSSNGRPYVQTSSNSASGVNQLALAIITTGITNVVVAYDVEIISAQPRTVGVVMQYRVGTSGTWTTVSGTGNPYSQAAGTTGIKANASITLPVAAENQPVVQIRWATWRGTEAGSSSGIAIDNVSVTGNSGVIQPSVTTTAATAITTTSATFNGNITSDGGSLITDRGFCYKTSPGVTIADNPTSAGGTATGTYSGNFASLSTATNYFYKAYAINGVGTTLSATEINFWTYATEPASHSTTFTSSVISQTQIDLSFDAFSTITNATGYLVLKKTLSAITTGFPVDGTAYTVGTTIGDATVAALVTSSSATSVSIGSLSAGTLYYFTIIPYSNGSNSATTNYKTDGTIPSTNGTTLAPLAATSEVSGPVIGSQPTLSAISSLVTTDGAAVRVFDMKIYDYGTDGQPTKITQVTIKAGSNNSANWTNTIQGVKLSTDGGSSFVTMETPTIGASSIVIPVASGLLNISDNSNLTLSLFVYLKSTGLTDNQILEFKVDAAASSHGFVADATGSTFLATFAAAPVSNQITVEVVATKLRFVQQPSNAAPNTSMTPAVTVEATDANNNRDLNYATAIDITSSGTISGSPVAGTPASGLATFGSLTHTVAGTGLVLTAASGSLTSAISSSFTISSLLLDENFSYTAGSLLTANGWTLHSGTTNAITVTASSILFPGYLSSGIGNEVAMLNTGEDDNIAFATQTSGSVYGSFLVNVSAAFAAGDYFFHFCQTSGASAGPFWGRVFVKKDASNNLSFGISKASTTTISYSAFSYSLNTTYLIVVKHTFSTASSTDDVAYLFIDPAFNSSEPSATLTSTDASSDATGFAAVALRQGGSTTGPTLKLDGIRISTSWADIVGPLATPVTQAKDIVFSSVAATSFTATWTNGSGNSRAVFVKQATMGTATPVDNTTYPANTIFGSGASQIGSTGWYCVYNGTGNSVTITGLTAGTDYIVHVCDYNGTAGNELYNSTTGASGNPLIQATSVVASLPTVTSPTATAITINSATLGGNITTDGGSAITERGTVWNTSPGVTIANNPQAEGGTATGIFTNIRTGLPSGATIYYAAYAKNSVGTALSAESSFSTLLPEPQNQPINIAATAPSASTIMVTWADNNGTPPATGFLILGNKTGTFTDPPDFTDPANDAVLADGTGVMHVLSGVQTYLWTGLDPATQYFFKIYPYTNSDFNIDFKTDGAPAANATTPAAAAPVVAWQFGNPASVGSEITYNATTNNSNLNTSVLSRGTGIAPAGLVRAFTANGWDNAATKESAVTNHEYFQFTINAMTGYKISLSTLDATIRRSSASAPNAYIWKYSTDGTVFTEIGSDIGFTSTADGVAQAQINLSGISALQDVTFATTLTFRMYAWGGTSTGSTFSIGRYPDGITTNSLTIGGIVAAAGPSAPVLTTQAATSILSTTATGNGTITYNGGEDPGTRGFCWNLGTSLTDPDITGTKSVETGTFTTGAFTGSITGLAPGTQYKVRAYATNSHGTGYGSTMTFYTLSGEPSNHATSFTASATSQAQIDLAFSPASTITNAVGYLILQKTGSVPTSLPIDATGYSVGNTLPDGTVAAIINSTSTTIATINGLSAGTHYYFTIFPYNWDGVTPSTYNYKTDGTVPEANATTSLPLDATSDVSGPALGSQPNPGVLSSLATTEADAVRVFDMNIHDYATTDLQPTKITQVTIKAGTGNTANWTNTIQGIKLSTDGGTTFVTIGTPTISAASIVVPITSGNLIIPSGSSTTLSLYVYLKSTGLTDNDILVFKVDDGASLHGFIADPTGSTFITTFTAAPVSNLIQIGVVATKLKFVVQPTAVYVTATMSPAVTIEATDVNNNRDLDKTGSVALASSGTMTGPVTATLALGLGTFGNIVHTATGTGLVLTATYAGLTDAVSNSFNVTFTAVFTELVVPKYFASKTASSTNLTRTPFAVCLQIDNLLPNTSYDIKPGVGLTSEGPAVYGAGSIGVAGLFGSFNMNNAFTTNSSGSSGPFWVYIQPTGNATRFDAGQVHNLRIGYAVNGTTMPNTPNFIGTKQMTALDVAFTERTPATSDDGAFIKGSADPTTTGKNVLLFDNMPGTGDPLFSYQIRSASNTSSSYAELPTSINDIYMQTGTSAVGDYPAVIPIGANNPNGVQRIEARNADNTIFGYNTDDDGIWPSGVNTTTLARREVGAVTVTDAPLVPVTTKSLNVTVFLEGFYVGSGLMNAAKNAASTPQFGATIADKVTVELHDGTTPYNVAYTFSNVSLNTTGTLFVPTVPAGVGGSYYIVIKHRSSVEVWSAAPVSFAGNTISYNFSDAAAKAYGNVLKSLPGGVYGIYTGDVNQDGVVDAGDLVAVDNEAATYATGYLTNDVNGDGLVNLADINLLDANATIFVARMTP